MTTIRQERVSQLLFQELSVLIGTELADPRLSLITVTEVVVSRDLRSARVFIHRDEDDLSQQELLTGLRAASPFLRRELAVRCALRVVPELNFVYDETPERAARIDELLRQLAEERAARGESDDDDDVDGDDASQPGSTDPDSPNLASPPNAVD